MHVVIEGIIASGKTSLMTKIAHEIERRKLNWNCFPEPLDQWQDFHGENVLGIMYAEPKIYSFLFQTMAFSTKLNQVKFDKDVTVAERSILTQFEVFIPLLKEKGALTNLEAKVLDNLLEHMMRQKAGQQDLTIYLKVPASVALDRIRYRGRLEEQDIPLEYLKRMVELHDAWLEERKQDCVVWFQDGTREIDVPDLVANIERFCSYKEVVHMFQKTE